MLNRRFIVVIASAALFMSAFAQKARAHDEPVVGSLVGAGVGAVVAGPPGAAVGAVIGAAVGSHEAHQSDHGRRTHRHARREARYANGNGYSQAVCPPARVVYVETPGKTTITKVKRVCRMVPVRERVARR